MIGFGCGFVGLVVYCCLWCVGLGCVWLISWVGCSFRGFAFDFRFPKVDVI